MPSRRAQHQIDRLLDDAEQAMATGEWEPVRLRFKAVRSLDAKNADAQRYLAAAANRLTPATSGSTMPAVSAPAAPPAPVSFAGGRYQGKCFLGEAGKKVHLAHDTLLDRDVAFALIKTAGLDDAGRQRIRPKAQAIGRLGAHSHIVSVFDLGENKGQPYLVTELMRGGGVEGLVEHAPESSLLPCSVLKNGLAGLLAS